MLGTANTVGHLLLKRVNFSMQDIYGINLMYLCVRFFIYKYNAQEL